MTFLWNGVELERAAAFLWCLFWCLLLAAVTAGAPQKRVWGSSGQQPEVTGVFSHSRYLRGAALNAVTPPELRTTVLAHGGQLGCDEGTRKVPREPRTSFVCWEMSQRESENTGESGCRCPNCRQEEEHCDAW